MNAKSTNIKLNYQKFILEGHSERVKSVGFSPCG
jgi:hypothetical protein